MRREVEELELAAPASPLLEIRRQELAVLEDSGSARPIASAVISPRAISCTPTACGS